MPKLQDWLALSLLENMGGGSFRKLLDHFKDLNKIFSAGTSAAELRKITQRRNIAFENLSSPEHRKRIDKEIALAKKHGARIITWADKEYPDILREIYDPPILLFAKGTLSLKDNFCTAVVGSRKCSFYGQKMAREISKELCESGVVVASGLALGIDASAHEGALSGGGPTIAVLGCGLANIYPPQNGKLAGKIEENGVVISEYGMTMQPLKQNFPMRNRIISGLSAGVVIVEAREKSGALITADTALEQGRDVFVLPGTADSAGFRGSHGLLKQGAKFVTSAKDILQELGVERSALAGKAKIEKKASVTREENRIVSFLNSSPVHVDVIIEESGVDAKSATAILSTLEVKGRVKRLPGNHFVRIS